jgi:hypothetical protein
MGHTLPSSPAKFHINLRRNRIHVPRIQRIFFLPPLQPLPIGVLAVIMNAPGAPNADPLLLPPDDPDNHIGGDF